MSRRLSLVSRRLSLVSRRLSLVSRRLYSLLVSRRLYSLLVSRRLYSLLVSRRLCSLFSLTNIHKGGLRPHHFDVDAFYHIPTRYCSLIPRYVMPLFLRYGRSFLFVFVCFCSFLSYFHLYWCVPFHIQYSVHINVRSVALYTRLISLPRHLSLPMTQGLFMFNKHHVVGK